MGEHRRPAGVDPAVLRPRSPSADLLQAQAREIGRRAAVKIVALDCRTSDALTTGSVAEIVEAEIRSAWGSPRDGEVVVRLSYEEAVQVATAVVDAQGPERTPEETTVLGDLREKFLLALGLL